MTTEHQQMEALTAAYVEVKGEAPSLISRETNLVLDLDLDSFDMIEISLILEEHAGARPLEVEEKRALNTVGDVLDALF